MGAASASYTGVPPVPGLDGGVPHSTDQGYPMLILDGVPPHPDLRCGPPIPSGPGMGSSHLDLGWGTPPPSRPEIGYPPCKCEQTETITFPHPSDADGNNLHQVYFPLNTFLVKCLMISIVKNSFQCCAEFPDKMLCPFDGLVIEI